MLTKGLNLQGKNDYHPQYFIKYSVSLKNIFHSDKAALIFERLEYWAQRSNPQKGFWKFFEPCQHPLYRHGDSWEEEIGMSRKVWAKAFTIIGNHYKTKSAFLKQKDPFKGKLYASYYDRRERRTYYLRNHAFIQTFLENIYGKLKETGNKITRKESPHSPGDVSFQGSSKNCPQGSSLTRAYKDISSNKELPPSLKDTSTQVNEVTAQKTESESINLPQEMLTLWNQTVEHHPDRISMTFWRDRKLKRCLKNSFNNDLCEWKSYCIRIAHNDFLMGGGQRGWKASLDWALHSENIQKVREGVYTGQKEPISAFKETEQPFNRDDVPGSEAWKDICQHLAASLGLSTFRSWFQDVRPVDLEGCYPRLQCASRFRAQWIQSHFSQTVESVFRKHFPQMKILEIC